MSIKLYVQGSLSAITQGKEEFEVNGRTVGECLNHLVSIIPKMKEILFFEKGSTPALRSNIEVLINKRKAGVEVLAQQINDGDEIQIKKNIR